MPKTHAKNLPDACVYLINSLGGPPLPMGQGVPALKVILENQAAAELPASTFRIANAMAARRF